MKKFTDVVRIEIHPYKYPVDEYSPMHTKFFLGRERYSKYPYILHICLIAEGLSLKSNKIELDDWDYIFEQIFCQKYLEPFYEK